LLLFAAQGGWSQGIGFIIITIIIITLPTVLPFIYQLFIDLFIYSLLAKKQEWIVFLFLSWGFQILLR